MIYNADATYNSPYFTYAGPAAIEAVEATRVVVTEAPAVESLYLSDDSVTVTKNPPEGA